ncbi:hypothetical protein RHMOL_Rhmol01G0269300 [Rhododendron molle]|uniref:Uncharacterized protein n=1 Tax=Rhododendron molle TaxID=49168 RepID=A0ACC0Q5L7_RHOML|nr:hypothetical protein RHMOL_Rhmol01G0269300 [Rhododendron molle]
MDSPEGNGVGNGAGNGVGNGASESLPPPPPVPPNVEKEKSGARPYSETWFGWAPSRRKGIGRNVVDRVHLTYDTELAGKDFACDGEKSLLTLGPLPKKQAKIYKCA